MLFCLNPKKNRNRVFWLSVNQMCVILAKEKKYMLTQQKVVKKLVLFSQIPPNQRKSVFWLSGNPLCVIVAKKRNMCAYAAKAKKILKKRQKKVGIYFVKGKEIFWPRGKCFGKGI